MTNGLVMVAEFLDYGDAALVAGALRGEGIRAVLPHDPRFPLEGTPPPPPRTSTNVNDGVLELLVEEPDAARAEVLLGAFAAGVLPQAFTGEEIEVWQAEKKAGRPRRSMRERLRILWIFYVLAGLSYLVAGAAVFATRP